MRVTKMAPATLRVSKTGVAILESLKLPTSKLTTLMAAGMSWQTLQKEPAATTLRVAKRMVKS